MAYANKEVKKQKEREYYQANREQIAEQQREYYQANREQIAERRRKYRLTHREQIAERKREYHQANREQIAEWKREYYQANREPLLEQQREYYQARYQAWKSWLISQGFGQCLACGYDADFTNVHAHHINPKTKVFDPAAFYNRAPFTQETCDELRAELDKCIPLCSKCHAKIHSKKKTEVEQAIQDRYTAMLALCLMHQPLSEERKAA